MVGVDWPNAAEFELNTASIEGLMAMTCSIERNRATSKNRRNTKTEPEWESLYTDVPCRAWMSSTRMSTGQSVDTGVAVDLSTVYMIVPVGTDITPNDRISEIRENGVVKWSSLTITGAIQVRPDHLQLILEQAQ